MTVIRPNSISGITSITAQSNSLEYYDSDGNTLTVTGNINSSGISTFSTLTATTISGVSTVGVTSVYLDSINDLNYPTAGPLSNRNLIINGAMQVAQRGTSSAGNGLNTTSWPVDRFKVANNTDAVLTVSQESSGAPEGFQYWSKVLVTTADTSIASNQYSTISQFIEGYNFAHCNFGLSNAKTIKVSFYFKTNKSGTYCMIHRNESANRNFLYEFVPSSLDTWERIEYTVPGDITGTWNVSTGIGFRFELCMSNGSAYQSSTVGSWFSGQYYHSTPNQVNLYDTINNYIGITGVQVEIGENATEFEHRSYGEELALCQRYYYQTPSHYHFLHKNSYYETQLFYFPTTMRASPTVNVPTPVLRALNGSSNVSYTGLSISRYTDGFYLNTTTTNNNTFYTFVMNGSITADAEL